MHSTNLRNKLLYLQVVMARFLKIIGLLVLTFAFWQTLSNLFIGTNLINEDKSVDIHAVAVKHQADEACFSSPQLPYLPDAELASSNGHIQLLTFPRVQRSYIVEYLFSLRDCGEKLAQREATLALHKEKLFDTTTYYRCHPVCKYYVYTLRRIII